jgi:hypothetical protein
MKRETSKKLRNIINIATAIILVGGIVIPIVLTLVSFK